MTDTETLLSWREYVRHLRHHFASNRALLGFLKEHDIYVGLNNFIAWSHRETKRCTVTMKRIAALFGDSVVGCKGADKVKLLKLVMWVKG